MSSRKPIDRPFGVACLYICTFLFPSVQKIHFFGPEVGILLSSLFSQRERRTYSTKAYSGNMYWGPAQIRHSNVEQALRSPSIQQLRQSYTVHTQWKDFLRIFKGKAGLAVTLNQAWLYGMPGWWISCQRCPRCGCGANGGNMEECADWMVGMVGMFGEAIYQQQTQGWTEQPPRGWHTARAALH